MFPLEWLIKWEIYEVLYQFNPCLLTHFKFSGAAKLHDPTNMKLIEMKDKGKLNRMIKNQLITHVAFLLFFEIQYLFVNFIPIWGKYIYTFYYQGM